MRKAYYDASLAWLEESSCEECPACKLKTFPDKYSNKQHEMVWRFGKEVCAKHFGPDVTGCGCTEEPHGSVSCPCYKYGPLKTAKLVRKMLKDERRSKK